MTMRSVQDRFWSDGWVRKLNPLDRYLFLYLLTNEHTNWCGIYELDLGMMAFESGLDREELQRSMLPRLSPKALYVDGWVYIPNWLRHHLTESGSLSPTQQKGIDAAWKTVPERIRLKLKGLESEGIPYAYPIGGVSPSSSAFSSSLPKGSSEELLVVSTKENGEEREPRVKKDTSYYKVFELWGKYPLNWRENRTEIAAAKNILLEHSIEDAKEALAFYSAHKKHEKCPQILKPSDLDRKWVNLVEFSNKVR